jgi:hypothetical protein
MDIITNFAAGEEAVGAIFGNDQDKGKRKEEDPAWLQPGLEKEQQQEEEPVGQAKGPGRRPCCCC